MFFRFLVRYMFEFGFATEFWFNLNVLLTNPTTSFSFVCQKATVLPLTNLL